jgi:hypothetical protein
MFHKVSYWWFRVTQYITPIGLFYKNGGFITLRVSDRGISGGFSQEKMRIVLVVPNTLIN